MLDYFINSGLWIQFFGGIGYALCVCAGVSQQRSKILGTEILGYIIVVMQWLLLGSPSLAIANGIYAYATMTGFFADKSSFATLLSRLSLPLMAVFILMFGGSSLGYGLFVIFASAIGMLAKSQVEMKNLRALAMAGSFLWFFLNWNAGSIPGMVCNISYFSVHAYGLLRLYNPCINLIPFKRACSSAG